MSPGTAAASPAIEAEAVAAAVASQIIVAAQAKIAAAAETAGSGAASITNSRSQNHRICSWHQRRLNIWSGENGAVGELETREEGAVLLLAVVK